MVLQTLTVSALIWGSPLERRSLSLSLSRRSWERDLGEWRRRSRERERERRCRERREREPDRERLRLGDLDADLDLDFLLSETCRFPS